MSTAPVESSLVISYLGLRKGVGIIGIGLPFVLVVGKWLLDGPGIQSSISAYYYTVMRDVFVGSLCAIGLFLMSYRGYEIWDNVAGKFACVFAVGVALFPTTPEATPSPTEQTIGYVHYGFAAALFLVLACFCLVLFRKTNPKKPMTRRKVQRNAVYTVCGYTILACIGLLAVHGWLLRETVLARFDPVFWLETTAILAFGVSWLTKGETILADETEPAVPRHRG